MNESRSQRGPGPLNPFVSAVLLIASFLAVVSELAYGQRYKAEADPDSQEGQFLELIGLQSDTDRKLALIDQFTQRYPTHPAISWAYEQLQKSAFQAGQWDKALAYGEKLAKLNPDDIDAAQMNIKAAQAKGDRAAAKIWLDHVSRSSQRIMASPPPKDPEQLERWNNQIAAASQHAVLDEYGLYKKALEGNEPAQQIKALDELLSRNPSTQYLPQALIIYLNAYRAVGDSRNALLTAEKILKSDRDNEDALLLCAEAYLQRGTATDIVLSYSARIIELMNTRKKPAGVRQEDWDRKKDVYTGMAYWMTGSVHVTQKRFDLADVALRAALPLLRQTGQPIASVLFYLGWSNYKLEHLAEAVRFFTQCSAIPGQFQDQAEKNLAVIRAEQKAKE